jgi:cell division septation protein DedD
MKIDKQKLIDLLVEKTGMDLDAVELQLDQLIERIQEAAEKGKALEIKGFGMFYFSKEGELKFDPSDDLQTEVNYKYAGMEPVEIKKPRESAGKQIAEEEKEEPESGDTEEQEPVWGFDPESEEAPEIPESQEPEKKSEKTAAEDESEKQLDSKDDESSGKEEEEKPFDPFADFDHGIIKSKEDISKEEEQEKTSEQDKKPEEKKTGLTPRSFVGEDEFEEPEEKADDLDDIFPSFEDESKKNQPAAQSRGALESKQTAGKNEKRKKNPVQTLITTIVFVMVSVVGVIVAIDFGLMDSLFGDSDPPPREITLAEPQPQVPVDSDAMENLDQEPQDEAADAADQEQPGPTEIEEVEEPDTPEFGLHGSAMSIDGRYYSIILHSMRNENRAREMRDELQDEGYRAVMNPVESEEHGTMWRIGVGQFETISQAQSAASELPQNYRDNHFIGLIQ